MGNETIFVTTRDRNHRSPTAIGDIGKAASQESLLSSVIPQQHFGEAYFHAPAVRQRCFTNNLLPTRIHQRGLKFGDLKCSVNDKDKSGRHGVLPGSQ
ncbi:MAG: hypothetical protein AAGA38_11810 [Pseudomonadota bacterium]